VAKSDDWLDAQSQRILARQQSRADTAKIVATFVAGIAGALVASALQTDPSASRWDWIAAWALTVTVLLTAAVVLLDRMQEPDHSKVLQLASMGHWNEDHKLFELRAAALEATAFNERIVTRIGALLWLQLIVGLLTGAAAAYSMLGAS